MTTSQSQDQATAILPDVISMSVTDATTVLHTAGFMSLAWQNVEGQGIPNPIGSWIVQPNGENPRPGQKITTTTTITLTIAAIN